MASLRSFLQSCVFFFLSFSLLLPGLSLADDGDESVLLSEIGRSTNASLLWGPYRPNLYFGVKPRIPKSLSTGLMWAQAELFNQVVPRMRHTCEQQEMSGYGWDEYDIRSGGVQTIHDDGNNIDMTTEFIKMSDVGGSGNWGVRIKGVPKEDIDGRPQVTTVLFYVTLEGAGELTPTDIAETVGYDGDITLEGSSPDLGSFKIDVTRGAKNQHPGHKHPSYKDKPLDKTFLRSARVPEEALWQSKAIAMSGFKLTIDEYLEKYTDQNMPPAAQAFTLTTRASEGNIHIIQNVFVGPFEFDVLYTGSETPMTSEALTEGIKAVGKKFSTRYVETFAPQAPFNKPQYEKFSKALFSNLLGGVGYFHGDAVVDRSYASEYEEEDEEFWLDAAEARGRGEQKLEGPYELFTAIPSRPFFPRGFLWDEGFHLMPIIEWDTDLVLEILKSWFNSMDQDGWIAREQILGAEARSKVPEEFQVQYPHYANPPTLFFVLNLFLDKLEASTNGTLSAAAQKVLEAGSGTAQHLTNPVAGRSWLKSMYPLLKRHYFWYRKTQRGELKAYDRKPFDKKEAYRWRGRTPQHILTSGLDDYPRAQPPHPGELHVDLMSWMGMMTRAMKRIANSLDEKEDVAEFAGYEEGILRNLDDLHWDKDEEAYCDATVDEYEDSVLVCHKGYVSLFPFMTGLLDADHKHLPAVLDLIGDPAELWSDHGIRSLSKQDAQYGTEENYWRSPVWMPMNYLILRELHRVAETKGPHQKRAADLYSRLRVNLVNTVYKAWKETGYAWEQYDPATGAGQRTQHFTGWTSLVVNVLKMPDLSGGKAKAMHDEL